MSQCMRFPTMWYVRPAKPQISLRICAVWSEPLLVAWVFYDCQATDWTPFGVSKHKRRLSRLVRVRTCQNATLLEISCTGSVMIHVRLFYSLVLSLDLHVPVIIYYFRCAIPVLTRLGTNLDSSGYQSWLAWVQALTCLGTSVRSRP